MIFAETNFGKVVSSTTVVAVASGVVSEPRLEKIRADSNRLEVPTNHRNASSGLQVKAVSLDQWDASKNGRFKELAVKEAIGALSIEEEAELDELTRLRRFGKNPRTAEEILWQRHQQKVTRNFVEAFEAYVNFHDSPRKT